MDFRGVRQLAAACLLLASETGYAVDIPVAVAPVTVRMDAGSDYGSVSVSNRGDASTGIEVDLVRMTWVDGREVYAATQDFVFSPPAFRLAGGGNRLLRFRFTGNRSDNEQIYRLFVRQLPEATGPTDQIRFVVNLGVPIFVAPLVVRPALALTESGGGVELRNTGNVTLTVRHLEGPGCPGLPFKVETRLFPAQSRQLPDRPLPCVASALTDRGAVPLSP